MRAAVIKMLEALSRGGDAAALAAIFEPAGILDARGLILLQVRQREVDT